MDQRLIKDVLCDTGQAICKRLHNSLREQSLEDRTAVYVEAKDDTIYQIDRDVEDLLVESLAPHASNLGGIVLVAEGIEEGGSPIVLPENCSAGEAELRMIIDPIDGTRGIMYEKRSAFFLAGAAPNRGEETCLQDITVAVMVELPTSRSYMSDTLWAIRGHGAFALTHNLIDGTILPCPIAPSRSKTILGGFAQISRFFPPGREILAQIEEETIATLFPDAPPERSIIFEDQYISTGGQLYEILMGHDRFVADLRESLFNRLKREGRRIGIACHPYDLSAHLIGEEAGIAITGRDGTPLDALLNTTDPVDWIAYANPAIRAEVEPVLQDLMRKHGLL